MEFGTRTCPYCGHELSLESGFDFKAQSGFAKLTCKNCNFQVGPVKNLFTNEAMREVICKFDKGDWTKPNVELLPCPACGALPGNNGPNFHRYDRIAVGVECARCGCSGSAAFDVETATKVWNIMCEKAKNVKKVELEPCPICGSEHLWCDPSNDTFRVGCVNCGCSFLIPSMSRECAELRWNNFVKNANYYLEKRGK